MAISIPPRSDIPQQYRWNAESLFSDLQAWEDEYKDVGEALKDESYAMPEQINSEHEMFTVLEQELSLFVRAKTLYLYAGIEHSVETSNSGAAQRQSQARGLLSQVQARLAALQPMVVKIGQETIAKWMDQNPDLATYHHFFQDIFRKQDHIRSEEVETLLGLLSNPFSGTSTIARMLTNADFQFEPALTREGERVDLTQGSQPRLMTDPDRLVRQTAWENYLDLYLSHQNTLATTLETSIKQNVLTAETRGFRSTLEAALFEYQIPSQVYDNLLKSFEANLPLWHRYWRIRSEALGVDPLRPYDTWAPLTNTQPQVPYEQAVDWICAGLEPLGGDYVAAIRRGCGEERWVDVFPNQGKRGGAFSSGAYGTFPFIVMNYNNTLISLSTLAHELGHSMHSYLTWKTQPPVYSDYSLFVAEVASNFHQAMVRAYLLEKFDEPNFRIAVIEEAMANYYRYLLIMPTLARFELESHQRVEKGQGLTASLLRDLCVSYFKEAYGTDIQFDPEHVGMIWATFGHLYVDYYVYQYATGIAGAHAISQKILSGERGAVDNYLDFLKLGGSRYPIEALKVAGVDLTSTEPIQAAFDGMGRLIDELETLLGEVIR
jgi:oligoendopeptidase F